MEALKNDIMIDETLYEAAPDEIEATRRLFQIVRILRRLCPWDSVQTHDSLRICTGGTWRCDAAGGPEWDHR